MEKGAGTEVVGIPFNALAMARTWSALKEEREPIPPILPVIPACIRAEVAPVLDELANEPWQPAQSDA